MESNLVTLQTVRDIPPPGRQWLEAVLGGPLQDDQQVFLVALSPGRVPDDESRRRAKAGLETIFTRTEKHSDEQGVTDVEIEDALAEAMRHVRSADD